MSRSSVREVDRRLRVVSNTHENWDIQDLGDLATAVRLPLADNDQAEMSAILGIEPRMITEHRQVNTRTHDGSKSRVQHHGSQGAALQQRWRWSGLTKAAAVNDHVDIDIGQSVERFGQVFPHPTEMACTARLAEARQEQPTSVLLLRQWQRLIKNCFAQWATITVCLRYT